MFGHGLGQLAAQCSPSPLQGLLNWEDAADNAFWSLPLQGSVVDSVPQSKAWVRHLTLIGVVHLPSCFAFLLIGLVFSQLSPAPRERVQLAQSCGVSQGHPNSLPAPLCDLSQPCCTLLLELEKQPLSQRYKQVPRPPRVLAHLLRVPAAPTITTLGPWALWGFAGDLLVIVFLCHHFLCIPTPFIHIAFQTRTKHLSSKSPWLLT